MKCFEKSAVCSIKILNIHTPTHKPQWVSGRNYYSLSYRYSGKIKIEADKQEYTSCPGSITFIPKGKEYRTTVCENTHMVVVHFTLSREIKNGRVGVIEDKTGALKPYFDRLATSYANAEPHDFDAMALFYQLLSELTESGNTERSISPVVALAKKEMDNHFANPALSISALSASLGVSDSYLRRAFKETYGTPPLAYLTRVRIRRAKTLLETEFFSIEQIAALCGFQSVGYFIQCFHKETGETPGTYRKRKRGIIL